MPLLRDVLLPYALPVNTTELSVNTTELNTTGNSRGKYTTSTYNSGRIYHTIKKDNILKAHCTKLSNHQI